MILEKTTAVKSRVSSKRRCAVSSDCGSRIKKMKTMQELASSTRLGNHGIWGLGRAAVCGLLVWELTHRRY